MGRKESICREHKPAHNGVVLVLLLFTVATILIDQKKQLRLTNGNIKEEFSSVGREQVLAYPKEKEASFLFPEEEDDHYLTPD